MATPDPRLVQAIRQQPAYLQAPLLTTALIESGGNVRAVGDRGQSFGAFQENIRGRGSGLTPQQSYDPVGSTRRAAQEFQTFFGRGARGADLAYRAQRPADRASYVQRYNSLLPEAQRILGQVDSAPGSSASIAPAGPGFTDPGSFLPSRVRPGRAELLPGALDYLQGYQRVSRDDLLSGRPFGAAGQFEASEQYDPLALLGQPAVQVTPPQITAFRPSVQDVIADADVGAPIQRGRQPGPSGLVNPLSTAMPTRSEYGIADPEGAPGPRGRIHGGLDWFASPGSPVAAPVNGRVVEVKPSRGNTGQVFGGTVKIQAADGKVYVFRHVDPSSVRVGQQVRAGAPVAGVTDWQDGRSHAHIEVWKTLAGGYRAENLIDPLTVFSGRR